MRYTLRQLEVFLATARHENVSRAAKELSMSQSAASGALKELENQFDIRLFDRIGKRLHLSELGKQLQAQAQRLLDEAQDMEQALADNRVMGKLNIGATLTIGNYLTIDIIADFKRRYPGAEVSLEIANTEVIAQRVAGFELDSGLIEGEYSHPDLDIYHWRQDELVVFAAPDHPLLEAKTIRDKHLVAQPWILRESGSGTRQAFDRAMHGIVTDLHVAMELQQPRAIKRAVAAGLGIGCLSKISLEEDFHKGTLVPLNVTHRDFTREWFIITHKRKYHSEALVAWLALCKDHWQLLSPTTLDKK